MSKAEYLSEFLVKKDGQIAHYCPACDELHFYAVAEPFPNGARWSFNGDAQNPSLTPSMLIKTGHYVDRPGWSNKPGDCAICDAGGEYGSCGICHYFLSAGWLEYCQDSTHKLAGMRLRMVPIPEKYKSWFE